MFFLFSNSRPPTLFPILGAVDEALVDLLRSTVGAACECVLIGWPVFLGFHTLLPRGSMWTATSSAPWVQGRAPWRPAGNPMPPARPCCTSRPLVKQQISHLAYHDYHVASSDQQHHWQALTSSDTDQQYYWPAAVLICFLGLYSGCLVQFMGSPLDQVLGNHRGPWGDNEVHV